MSKPTIKKQVTDRHIDAAARALKELEHSVSPEDAQICITLMVAYLTERFQWQASDQPKLLANNMKLLKRMGLMMNVLNSIHSKMIGSKIFIPKTMPPIATLN